VAGEAVVDNSRHDFEGGFKEGDWARVGEGLLAGFGNEDKEGLKELGRKGGPAEAGVAEQRVGNDGVTWTQAEEAS
jgi:general stress protein YciG